MDMINEKKANEQRRQQAMKLLTVELKRQHKVNKKSQPFELNDKNKNDFNIRQFSNYPEIKAFNTYKSIINQCRVENPYFRVNETITTGHTQIAGKKLINFSGYNYLGFSGQSYVRDQAKKAIDQYGTSPSASRLVSGEKPIHGELEKSISQFVGVEASLVFTSGHATNVTVIGHFFNSQDLIIYDEFSHNSAIEGCLLSGARRVPFEHNNVAHCEKIITENKHKYQKIVVIIEGAYSMDGDIPPLEAFIKLRKRQPILLYVDEAHSLGTVGASGRGISEHFSIDPNDVDFWMGTLSKSLASNGGYIAGKRELIDYLKYTTPGFVYSAGITPANAAAALASLELLQGSDSPVSQLQANANHFRTLAKSMHLDIGLSEYTPIVPIIIGKSEQAIKVADSLFSQGINVHAMFHPAVAMGEARLRFFISSDHTQDDITYTLQTLSDVMEHYGLNKHYKTTA